MSNMPCGTISTIADPFVRLTLRHFNPAKLVHLLAFLPTFGMKVQTHTELGLNLTIRLHQGDLPNLDNYTSGGVAIDTETLGLKPHRDRLCVVQLSPGDGTADIVQIAKGQSSAPNIQKLLADTNQLKLFHFGRFDIAVLYHAFGTLTENVSAQKSRHA